jgi:hypothetical protein
VDNFVLLIILVALLGVAGFAAARQFAPAHLRTLLYVGLGAVLTALLASTYLRSGTDALIAANPSSPTEHVLDGYVSSDQCRACHPREYATWHASYHRTMTQRPSPETVAGVFGVSLQRGNERIDLLQRDGRYFAEIPMPDWWRGPREGERLQRPIALMTGSHNYQVYWLATGNTTLLAQLPYVYLVAERMWAPRVSLFMVPPDAQIGSEYGRWNTTCIRCHTTSGRPRPTPDRKGALTEVAELGIACEACHGPAGAHVEAMQDPLRRYLVHLGVAKPPAIVNPKQLSAAASVQVCGQCHSVHEIRSEAIGPWFDHGPAYRPGDDLDKTLEIPTLQQARSEPAHFWPDGMYRVIGREYNGVVASPCFAGGEFSCLSCHEPHQQASDGRPVTEWRVNQLHAFGSKQEPCVQCHAQFKEAASVTAHTHHDADSTGSECMNCHMPYTVYGLGRTARSHHISSPRVDLELQTGRPNACNLCHVDRTLAWTAEQLSARYAQQAPALSEDQRRIAASLLWLYRGDANQRALASWALGWPAARSVAGSDWVVPHLVHAIGDPYQVLGLVAWRSLRRVLGEEAMPGKVLMREPSARSAAAAAAVGPTRVSRDPAGLLVSPSGELDAAEVTRLLEQRDNRPVVLSE